MNSIVLVDDSADIRRLVRARLVRTGAFEVVGEGANGLDAVGLAAEHQPDIVLLDVSMSGMDGLEAIPLIITAAPRTRVVMFSGFDEEGLSAQARSMGASDFIEKSAPMSELASRLLAVLGTSTPIDLAIDANPGELIEEHLERFRAAFDEAAIGMATLTLTGRIVRANAALDRLAGVQPGELVGRLFMDLADGDSLPAISAAVMRVASGVIDADNATHRITTTSRRLWVTSTVAVVRDSAGSPLYLFLQVQDINERRVAEHQLLLSEEMFRLLIEGVQDYAIFMLDPDGHIASWNNGAERIKGYSATEVIGRHFRMFYEQVDRDRKHPEHELEIARTDGRYEEEGWRVRKDGSTFWANVVITAIYGPTRELIGFAKVTRDVTDRLLLTQERDRASDQLAAAARERTEFLAVTAHELRGPVSLLHGFAELLNDHWRELDDAERDDMMLTLVRSSKRLQRLVEDLLMASRLESGAVEIRLDEVALAPIVRAVVNELAPPSAPVQIDVECDEDVRVVADTVRLHQILNNYVTNALRYAAPPITVRAARRGSTVEIVVEDRGSGVPKPLEERLFDKFSHGSHDESTGLGLFIVRELAVAQGGDARDEPRPDGGSRFVLELPAPRTR